MLGCGLHLGLEGVQREYGTAPPDVPVASGGDRPMPGGFRWRASEDCAEQAVVGSDRVELLWDRADALAIDVTG